MKKLTAFLIALVIILTPLQLCFAADGNSTVRATDCPSVVITGYMTPGLYTNWGEDDETGYWVGEKAIPKLIPTALAFMATFPVSFFPGGEEICGKAMAEAFVKEFEFSKIEHEYDTRSQEPAKATYKYYKDNGERIFDKGLIAPLAEEQGDDMIFMFGYDWRENTIDSAADLDRFIDNILEYTGSEKVNIFGLSYGGLMTATYLSIYGEKEKVNNVVMDVPALYGTEAIGNFFFSPDMRTNVVANFVADLLGMTTHFNCSIVNCQGNKAIKVFAENIIDVVLSWPSFWDLMDTTTYEQMKALYPDYAEKISENSDRLHYEIMTSYKENFEKCRESGTKISIVADYTDYPTIFGGTERGDILIETSRETGAKIAPVGETLGDNYTQMNACCGRNHISPDGIIDASCAILPDNTWFVKDHYHGLYEHHDEVVNLLTTLMLADEETDVFSLSGYSQFIGKF